MSVTNEPDRLRIARTYEILEPLGRGAFGQVYKARQVGEHGFTRDVAIKVSTCEQGGGTIDRLREEAKILSLVRHRAIVHVDDLLELEDGTGIVMELVDGLDLAQVLTYGSMPVGPATEVVIEIAGALDCAQRARGPGGHPLLLQHRDVKPANIMLTANGETKLLDFGVAHANLADEGVGPSPSFASRGYVAPERVRGEPHFNSDVYALGVVYFEMMSGQRFGSPPLDSLAHTTWCKHALRALPAGVPPAARRLLLEMLAWDPQDRPTAREVERRAVTITRTVGTTLRDWTDAQIPDFRFGLAADSGARTAGARSTTLAGQVPAVDSPRRSLPSLRPSRADPSLSLVNEPPPETGLALHYVPLLLVLLFLWALSVLVVMGVAARFEHDGLRPGIERSSVP